jgi:YidC/Oxa1 family membrane protein insertase
MVDKKTLPLLIILIVIVIFYWPILDFLGLTPEPQEPDQSTAVTDSADTGGVAPDTVFRAAAPDAARALTPARPSDQPEVDTTDIDTIIVNTGKYAVTLTSFGGGPVSYKLREYTYRDGEQIEMIPGANLATPEAAFAGGTFSSSEIHYSSSLPADTYDATSEPLQLEYSHANPDGGAIIKRYTFYPGSYHFDLVLEIVAPETFGFERNYSMIWNSPLGVSEPDPKTDYDAMEAVAMMAGSREKLDDFNDDRLDQSLTGNTTWAGVRNKYFAAVMIPQGRKAEGVFARGSKQDIQTPDGSVKERRVTIGMVMPFANVNVLVDSFTVFVGPLDYTLMSEYDVGLEDMLDIGTTPVVGWIIKPFAIGIIWLLPRMYDIIPNYGLVIILFALLIKIITLPLSMKSFKSMQAMKQLQPKIEELKKKHKKNPQAMNAEMMKMYKKHGVNPMSGCLPILPQMPLFFALFSVFRSTILLRDAPFVWFIDDLSRGATGLTDPYIVLVIIMVVAQFVSQKLTMATQQQQKVFLYIMPLFMGFIFYRFAAGLVLYWACFSIFSLLDYVVFKRRSIPEAKTA